MDAAPLPLVETAPHRCSTDDELCILLFLGFEATQIIKENPALRHIPIVAVTAQAMSGDQERILRSGCAAYLSKPFRVAELLEVVQKTLESCGGPGVLPASIEGLPQAS